MLRKIALIGLQLLIPLGIVTTVVAFERQRTPDWQQALAFYLDQTRPSTVETVVEASVKATLPWNFRGEMGHAFLEPRAWPWSLGRLPYPPDRLYCVVVTRTPTAAAQHVLESTRQLLYVAHHTDALWRVGWVVHEEPRQFSNAELSGDLTAIGCAISQYLRVEHST